MQAFESVQDIRQFLLKNLYRNNGRFDWRVNLDSVIRHYDDIMSGQDTDAVFTGRTLFLKGGDSDYIQPHHKEPILTLFPNARVRVITDTGHWLHAQKPELVSRTILRFLQR